MKLKVVLTKRPNVNINDFDFLIEALLQEKSKINKPRRSGRRPGGALVPPRRPGGALVPPRRPGGALVPINTQKAVTVFINKMGEFGNSTNGIFKWIMDQLRKLPGVFRSIGEKLKTLWEKIKGWMAKFHIVDRVKSLSMAIVCCVGFIACMVGSWISNIIFGKNSRRYRNMQTRADDNPSGQIIDAEFVDETAVFIETFGEILREDTDGNVFIRTVKGFIKKFNASGKIDNLVKATNNTTGPLKTLVKNLNILIKGSNATLNGQRDAKNLSAGTRFDDSLPALYESIIREAQAHKIKEIKKKAKRKVAIKQAKKKLSRGRI